MYNTTLQEAKINICNALGVVNQVVKNPSNSKDVNEVNEHVKLDLRH